jgi:hypothetical protein
VVFKFVAVPGVVLLKFVAGEVIPIPSGVVVGLFSGDVALVPKVGDVGTLDPGSPVRGGGTVVKRSFSGSPAVMGGFARSKLLGELVEGVVVVVRGAGACERAAATPPDGLSGPMAAPGLVGLTVVGAPADGAEGVICACKPAAATRAATAAK